MLLVVCAAGVVGDATESTYLSLFVLFLEIASDIRGIYTLFLKKRREWQGDAEVLAYMDLLLVITGSYFHQNRFLVCDKTESFQQTNQPDNKLTGIYIHTSSRIYSRRLLRQHVHRLRVHIQQRILHAHAEVSQLLRHLLVVVELRPTLPSRPRRVPARCRRRLPA